MRCPVRHDFDPLGAEYFEDPYAILNAVREAEPIFFAPSIGYWVVTRYDDVKAILSDPHTFSAQIALQPLMPLADEARAQLKAGLRSIPVLVDLDPPAHTRVRRQVADAFSMRRINRLKPTITRRARNLIHGFAAEGQADLVRQLLFPLPALTIFTLLGFPDRDAEQLKDWCADKIEVTWGRPSVDDQLRAVTSLSAFWDYCELFVEHRKQDLRDDLTSDLLRQRDSDPDALDDRELASVVFALSFAGHETTTKLLTNALSQLLSPVRPGTWQLLCSDPSLIPDAIDETLRFDSPVIAWRRRATRDTNVSGIDIPADAKMMLAFAAANHDARQFDNPEVFDIQRDNARTQLSFGWGIHYCLGASLARVESEIVLRQLCEQLPGLRLTREQQGNSPRNITFRAPQRLWAEWPTATAAERNGLELT